MRSNEDEADTKETGDTPGNTPPSAASEAARATDRAEPADAPTLEEHPRPKRKPRGSASAPTTETAPPAPPTVPRKPAALAAAAIATLSLIALDLGTKAWAEEHLSRPPRGGPPAVCEPRPSGFSPYQRDAEDPIPIVDGVLELSYAENCGAAFSLFDGLPGPLRYTIFYVAAIMATLILSRMFYQGKGGAFFAVAVPLVISGALGNFHDRVRFGYVVDFIHWESTPLIGFDYPIFNVADIAVVAGVIALVIDSFRERAQPASEAAGPTRSEKPA